MNRIGRTTAALLLLAFVVLVTASSASLIAYSTWSANRDHVMVMDEMGANPTEIYRYPKFSIGGDYSISPPGPDGTWVAIEDHDLYQVRADGTDLIKVICGEGTDAEGAPYSLVGHPQWSPDGSEILVQTFSHLALIPADFIARSDCSSDLEPIYFYDWEAGGEEHEWTLEGTAAWNDDGSKIAFFEYLHPGELYGDVRLVILMRQGTEWVALEPIPTSVEVFDGFPYNIDWQRGGDLLAFETRQFTGPHQSTNWLSWIHVETAEWGYITEGTSPSWSPDGSQLVFTDPGGRLVKWNYQDGAGEVIGSGDSADWQRGPITACGDGTCEGMESECTCPVDCGDPEPFEDPDSPPMCTDGIDNDCDGNIDANDPTFCCPDSDSDGFTSDICSGPDCNDADPSIHPGAGESCSSGVDDDCDGDIDCDDSDCSSDPICDPVQVDCSVHTVKRSCNAEPTCRWDNRNKECVDR